MHLSGKHVWDAMQKLLSTFKNMDAVQGYDGAQRIASIPGQLHLQHTHCTPLGLLALSAISHHDSQHDVNLNPPESTTKNVEHLDRLWQISKGSL